MATKDDVKSAATAFNVPVLDSDTEQDILDKIHKWAPSKKTPWGQKFSYIVAATACLAAWTSAYWGKHSADAALKNSEIALANLNVTLAKQYDDNETFRREYSLDRIRDAQKLIVFDIIIRSTFDVKALELSEIRSRYQLEVEKFPDITDHKIIDSTSLRKILLELRSQNLIHVGYPSDAGKEPTYIVNSSAFNKNAHRTYLIAEAKSEIIHLVFQKDDGIELTKVQPEMMGKYKLTAVEWSNMICDLIRTGYIHTDGKMLYPSSCIVPPKIVPPKKEAPLPKGLTNIPAMMPMGPM